MRCKYLTNRCVDSRVCVQYTQYALASVTAKYFRSYIIIVYYYIHYYIKSTAEANNNYARGRICSYTVNTRVLLPFFFRLVDGDDYIEFSVKA